MVLEYSNYDVYELVPLRSQPVCKSAITCRKLRTNYTYVFFG